jgi:F0F1-type ATP synthase membrane subunit b/b'
MFRHFTVIFVLFLIVCPSLFADPKNDKFDGPYKDQGNIKLQIVQTQDQLRQVQDELRQAQAELRALRRERRDLREPQPPKFANPKLKAD